MSLPMTHLTIAYEISKEIDEIQDKGTYLVGALSPDSVHFREHYQSEMKRASHLWNHGPYWGKTEDSSGWKESIYTFFEAN